MGRKMQLQIRFKIALVLQTMDPQISASRGINSLAQPLLGLCISDTRCGKSSGKLSD